MVLNNIGGLSDTQLFRSKANPHRTSTHVVTVTRHVRRQLAPPFAFSTTPLVHLLHPSVHSRSVDTSVVVVWSSLSLSLQLPPVINLSLAPLLSSANYFSKMAVGNPMACLDAQVRRRRCRVDDNDDDDPHRLCRSSDPMNSHQSSRPCFLTCRPD